MAKQVQLRRGTTSQMGSFTGAAGEVAVDTDKKTAVVHDGSTAGGIPLARETGAISAQVVSSPAQITADQNDYAIGAATLLRISTDAVRNFTGFAGGAANRLLTITNVDVNAFILKDESASSTAANRFSFGYDLVIGPKHSALLYYDSTASRWKKLAAPTKESLEIAVSDESTALTTGTAKITFRMPYPFYVTEVRASVNTVSSSGTPTVDVKEGGVSIFSTTLTIDVSEKTSQTAAVPAVISDHLLADDAEMTIDISTAGTGTKGLKVILIGFRI